MINKFKPMLRDTEKIDVEGSVVNLIRRIFFDPKYFPYKNCLNCVHFTEGLDYCKLYNQKPPAKVICYGCPSHQDVEEIPF